MGVASQPSPLPADAAANHLLASLEVRGRAVSLRVVGASPFLCYLMFDLAFYLTTTRRARWW